MRPLRPKINFISEAIRRRRVEELRLSLGKIDLDLTSEELARLRNEG